MRTSFFVGLLGVAGFWAAHVPAEAQIDASLFGKNLGPAIADHPDTGEEFMVLDEGPEPGAPPLPGQPGLSAGAPGIEDDTAREESAPSANPDLPQEADPGASGREEAKPEKRPWFRLPWRSKRRAEEERLARERAESGPKLGKLRAGAATNVGNVDDGLMPSELRRWKRDPRKAMVEARDQRKLLLLWMTDSLRSSTSKTQAIEVFRHTQFLRMAKDYMVLTKIDFAEADIASHPYTRYLKDRLKVLGYPTLILFSPESKEVWRIRGYRRGRFPAIIDALRHQVKTHVLREGHRHEQMLADGFREWTNDRNQLVFAKAVEVSQVDRTVLLLDGKGKRYRYPVVRLSVEDRTWLAENFLR